MMENEIEQSELSFRVRRACRTAGMTKLVQLGSIYQQWLKYYWINPAGSRTWLERFGKKSATEVQRYLARSPHLAATPDLSFLVGESFWS